MLEVCSSIAIAKAIAGIGLACLSAFVWFKTNGESGWVWGALAFLILISIG